jgi:hypothetical protein
MRLVDFNKKRIRKLLKRSIEKYLEKENFPLVKKIETYVLNLNEFLAQEHLSLVTPELNKDEILKSVNDINTYLDAYKKYFKNYLGEDFFDEINFNINQENLMNLIIQKNDLIRIFLEELKDYIIERIKSRENN